MSKVTKCRLCGTTSDEVHRTMDGTDCNVQIFHTYMFGRKMHICETCYRLADAFGTSLTTCLPEKYQSLDSKEIIRLFRAAIAEQGKMRRHLQTQLTEFYHLVPSIMRIYKNPVRYPELFENALFQLIGSEYSVQVNFDKNNGIYNINITHPKTSIGMRTWFNPNYHKES